MPTRWYLRRYEKKTFNIIWNLLILNKFLFKHTPNLFVAVPLLVSIIYSDVIRPMWSVIAKSFYEICGEGIWYFRYSRLLSNIVFKRPWSIFGRSYASHLQMMSLKMNTIYNGVASETLFLRKYAFNRYHYTAAVLPINHLSQTMFDKGMSPSGNHWRCKLCRVCLKESNFIVQLSTMASYEYISHSSRISW